MNKSQQMVVITNRPKIEAELKNQTWTGWEEIAQAIADQIADLQQRHLKSTVKIALDGYVGTDWSIVVENVQQAFSEKDINPLFLDIETCLKSPEVLEQQFEPYLGDDAVFGKLYKKNLKTLFDPQKLSSLKRSATNKNSIVYGTGASLALKRDDWSLVFYFDLTREESLKRNKQWMSQTGTQSISPKKLYYIDFQVNDRHRRQWISKIDLYVDGNDAQQPVMISSDLFKNATAELASSPFALKYLYEPGPWGGQWLKKVRNLPKDWVNCAWSYEVIAQEQSLLVELKQGTVMDIPWTTFLD
ncbi:hypothetical protein GF337_08685, partial [candidate division KSB1 bacterium]|nr:hypothetical protein [candidate division KSB1 bacterium]